MSNQRTRNVERVLAWSADKPLEVIWVELHRRMGASERPVKRITVQADDATDRVLSSLWGRALRFGAGRIPLCVEQLMHKLGLDYEELREVVTRKVGPIENRAQARSESVQARHALWGGLQDELMAEYPRSVERIQAAGVLGGDVSVHERRLSCFVKLVHALPLSEPAPLAILALQYTGDPHGLDAGTTLQKWLSYVLLEREGLSIDESTGVSIRDSAYLAGIVFDRLSTPTLTWSLDAEPDSPAGRALSLGFSDQVPVSLSSALLDRGAPAIKSRRVLCVENPSILEWMHLHGHAIPTICTSGWPSIDAQRLLRVIVAQGHHLEYAGDYDPSGLRIAQMMFDRFGAKIRMTAKDYGSCISPHSQKWEDDYPQTPWCPELEVEIRNRRVVRYQEEATIRESLVNSFAAEV